MKRIVRSSLILLLCLTLVSVTTFDSYAWVPEVITGSLAEAPEYTGVVIEVIEGGGGAAAASTFAGISTIAPYILVATFLIAAGVVVYNATDGKPLEWIKGKCNEIFNREDQSLAAADWDGHYYINSAGNLVVDADLGAELAAISSEVSRDVVNEFVSVGDNTFVNVEHDFAFHFPVSIYFDDAESPLYSFDNAFLFCDFASAMPWKYDATHLGYGYEILSYDADKLGHFFALPDPLDAVQSAAHSQVYVSLDGKPAINASYVDEHASNLMAMNSDAGFLTYMRVESDELSYYDPPVIETEIRFGEAMSWTNSNNIINKDTWTPWISGNSWSSYRSLSRRGNSELPEGYYSVLNRHHALKGYYIGYDPVLKVFAKVYQAYTADKGEFLLVAYNKFISSEDENVSLGDDLVNVNDVFLYESVLRQYNQSIPDTTKIGNRFNQSGIAQAVDNDWSAIDPGFSLTYTLPNGKTAVLDTATMEAAVSEALDSQNISQVLPEAAPAIVPVTWPVEVPDYVLQPGASPIPGTDPGVDPDPGVNPTPGTQLVPDTDPFANGDNQVEGVINDAVHDAFDWFNGKFNLVDKFPLCIPYDIYLLVNSFNNSTTAGMKGGYGGLLDFNKDPESVNIGSPQAGPSTAPVYHLSIPIGLNAAMNAPQYYEVDIDFSPWAPAVPYVRWGSGILWTLGLLMIFFRKRGD